jgi:hypothetical protein
VPDRYKQSVRLMRRYPILALNALEGLNVETIAVLKDQPVSTIERYLAREKRMFLTDNLKRAGIKVEGDEDMADLEEAYVNVTKQRR